MSDKLPSDSRYWLIIGRLASDFSDTLFTTGPCGRITAWRRFRIYLRQNNSLPLNNGVPDDQGKPAPTNVIINHTLWSASEILT